MATSDQAPLSHLDAAGSSPAGPASPPPPGGSAPERLNQSTQVRQPPRSPRHLRCEVRPLIAKRDGAPGGVGPEPQFAMIKQSAFYSSKKLLVLNCEYRLRAAPGDRPPKLPGSQRTRPARQYARPRWPAQCRPARCRCPMTLSSARPAGHPAVPGCLARPAPCGIRGNVARQGKETPAAAGFVQVARALGRDLPGGSVAAAGCCPGGFEGEKCRDERLRDLAVLHGLPRRHGSPHGTCHRQGRRH